MAFSPTITPPSALLLIAAWAAFVEPTAAEDQRQRVDYLNFAQGALPVAWEGEALELGMGMEQALLAIDGDGADYALTPKPGAAETRWVRVALAGGIDIQREKTFFEFSEIIGYGSQDPVPLSEAFCGKWKGKGVLLELKQAGDRVTGCYDGRGDLDGTVNGNLLRATGVSRDAGIPSVFVLAVGDHGEIAGVRSTNGAPFRLYLGDAAPGMKTECSEREVRPFGCGSIIHGIHFDFDSANIRTESNKLLDELSAGLKASPAAVITVVGHTSSEGSEEYNDNLSRLRAEAVVTAMTARGVDGERISAEGRGETQPIADNDTEAGRSLNRRVEITCR